MYVHTSLRRAHEFNSVRKEQDAESRHRYGIKRRKSDVFMPKDAVPVSPKLKGRGIKPMKLLDDCREVTAAAKNPEISGDWIGFLLSQLAGAEVSQKYTATSGHP